LDRVNRNFTAQHPNQLWVSDFTFVSTWQGFAYVAFIVESTLDTTGLIHHSDRGSQYVSIRYSDRLAQADIEPSVGSTGDSYDNALAETINGLYKTEVVRKKGPWKTIEALEWETLNWVHWFNQERLLEPIGHIPPAEFEALYERSQQQCSVVA
jgi:transposase InsO family protein